MTGKVYGIICVLILGMCINGSSLTINASVDRNEVSLGDQIQLKIGISGGIGTISDPVLPDLSGFEVYSAGRSQNISMVNGAFSSSLDINYILSPKKAGEFIIGPIIAKDNSSMYSTEPIKISVKQPGQVQSQIPKGQASKQSPSATASPKGEDFFIEQSLSKLNPYVGEQVILTIKFYQGINLYNQPTLSWPSYSGITVEDLPPNSRYYEIVGGRRYLVTEIKRALFPLNTGETTIESPRITIQPDDFGINFDPFSFFDRNLRDMFKRGEPKIISGNRAKLRAIPIPANSKYPDFNGAVGNYSLMAQVDKDSVGVDEPITLKLILSGSGNINSLAPLKLPEMADFRVYESGSTESISNSNHIVSGTKIYENAIIPKTPGKFTIAPIEFFYFDPVKRDYKAIRTEPISIIATGEGLADVGGAPKNIIGSPDKTFGYIITEFPRKRSYRSFLDNIWFWIIQLMPLAAIGWALTSRFRKNKLLKDRSYARRINAAKYALANILKANENKAAGDVVGAIACINDAVLGYLADKSNLESSGLTIDHIQHGFDVDGNLKVDLIKFLEQGQILRYSPTTISNASIEDLINTASEIIRNLELKL